MRRTLGEICQELEDANNKKERVGILKKYDCPQLRQLFKMNFDESIKFLLPEGIPPFKPMRVYANAPEMGETNLMMEMRRMYIFVDGGNTKITQIKREQLFIELLESLHPQEADVMIRLKEKRLKCGLTRATIDEAYPGLLPTKKEKENATSEVSAEVSKS